MVSNDADREISKPNGPPAPGDDVPQRKEKDDATPLTDGVFQLTVKLPHAPGNIQITVSKQEQVQDIRQSIVDTPYTFQYTCFHLEHRGKRINDFVELSEVEGIAHDPQCILLEDPYTEAQARMHVVRVRELIGASGDRADLVVGVNAGVSLCDGIGPETKGGKEDTSPVAEYDLNAPGSNMTLLPSVREQAPKTVKSLALSAWNPPPHHLRMRGHLLYLQVTTNEGEQHYLTCTVSGFFVNKSTNNKFDPLPRSPPHSFSAHSLLTLLEQLSPSFSASFQRLQAYNGQRDPLASYQLSNSIPVAPWLVSSSCVQHHQADLARSQEAYFLSGADNADTLRDWNEEFQSTRELPKETVQDRVFRERLTSKLFAEYTEAAVRGAVLIARGEVQPLNPSEPKDAQIFVFNNVFYSFGADGVGTFASDGGDEAARVAVGKDLQGVKAVNQLDISGLFTPGTVIVDYLGKRVVGQSIVPGIFKQRGPGEHQIDYGGVEGKEVVASVDAFVQPFAELSQAMRVKKHAVWDKEAKKHELETSVETKGLLGTDGRKYVLDLYRVTPLDITWLQQHRGEDLDEAKRYPHRMTVLRPELVESFRMKKLREYIAKEVEKKQLNDQPKKLANGNDGQEQDEPAVPNTEGPQNESQKEEKKEEKQDQPEAPLDISGFHFALNPDVFSGQQPQTEAEKLDWQTDETEVQSVCRYLADEVIPRLIQDMKEGDVGFPMDGQSLVRDMHKRGINVRYLGHIATLCHQQGLEHPDGRVLALGELCQQEMVSRAFKHFANLHLRALPPVFAQSCVSHLLNCLLGSQLNPKPEADISEEFKILYRDIELRYDHVTPAALEVELKRQVELRYRYRAEESLFPWSRAPQMLREICLKMGFQLEAKEYLFKENAAPPAPTLAEKKSSDSLAVPQTNGVQTSLEGSKKKKKKAASHSQNRAASASSTSATTTFRPEHILNIVPIVKEASPRSNLSEEALDAGRMSIQQGQRELGQDLLLESLSLHEQIYGILHPEVARVYYALSSLYYGLDEKNAAVELAKKAVIVSERTLGVDNAETVLAYLNLSLFEHATGNTKVALAYIRHALDLWKIVYGTRHPDSITTINNAAVMLQSLKLFHESRRWFEASLDVCEQISGKRAVATATLLFQLAQALALDHEPKSAVARMRESSAIFRTELGPDNQNTKEAEAWLETLTHSAVSQAKQANALLQNRRLMLKNGRTSRAPALAMKSQATTANPAGVTPTAPDRASQGIDQRNLDELLKYINGESSAKQTTPKKKTTNPKRRVGA